MMQMLHAAGVPCIGTYPDFEDPREINHRPVRAEFLARHSGYAFKLLNPHETPLPASFGPAYVIWLDRDPWQQAKSQAKMACKTMGFPVPNRGQLRRWARGLRVDRERALAIFSGWPRLVTDFESLLERPTDVAFQVSAFLRPIFPDLDHELMASRVKRRSPMCAPDLSIEENSVAYAERVRMAGGAL